MDDLPKEARDELRRLLDRFPALNGNELYEIAKLVRDGALLDAADERDRLLSETSDAGERVAQLEGEKREIEYRLTADRDHYKLNMERFEEAYRSAEAELSRLRRKLDEAFEVLADGVHFADQIASRTYWGTVGGNARGEAAKEISAHLKSSISAIRDGQESAHG